MLRSSLFALAVAVAWQFSALAQDADPDAWPELLDAVTAAPQSHEVLFENEDVRLLSVTILPGEEEPLHLHLYRLEFRNLEFRNHGNAAE